MSSLSKNDVYSDVTNLVSLDQVPEEVIHKLFRGIETGCYNQQTNLDAMEFAIRFLSEKETRFLFFRYFQRNSLNTLKRTMSLGSKRTAAHYISKISEALKGYVAYYFESDYDRDMEFVEARLSKDHRLIAEMLFRRYSKNMIVREPTFTASKKRINRSINDIHMLALKETQLTGYWKLVRKFGKVFQ